MAATVALAALATDGNAPPFPKNCDPDDVGEWIATVIGRVSKRLATPNDIRLLRYVAGDYITPNGGNIHRQLTELANRLEKGTP